jgi:SAM-dependent methyltransferase
MPPFPLPDWLVALLTEGAEVRDLGGGLGSFLPAEAAPGGYDGFAPVYDAVVSNRLYNAIFWGAPPAAHREFAGRALAMAPLGTVLDCPCGSLLFTAPLHPPEERHHLLLVDRSAAMLRRGRRRLRGDRRLSRACLLQGDLFHLPLRPASLAAVMSFGGLHVLGDRARVVSTLWDLVRPGGHLFLSSLIAGERPAGDWLLARLHRAGQVAEPFGRDALRAVLPPAATVDVRGSWAFVTATKKASASPGRMS